jgi:hypothetical protein
MKRPATGGFPVLVAVVAVSLGAAGFGRQKAGAAISFPTGYRHWTHVKSMAIVDKSNPLFGQFGGIHSVYVNDRGLPTLKKGGVYPDGSVFVFDLLEARLENGAYVEGKRKVLAVMVKSVKRYASTGGWGFQAFAEGNPQKPVVTDAHRQCFGCHASQKRTDYVFSAWRP